MDVFECNVVVVVCNVALIAAVLFVVAKHHTVRGIPARVGCK